MASSLYGFKFYINVFESESEYHAINYSDFRMDSTVAFASPKHM